MLGLDGKRALITGSSRGIGSAIAIDLAKYGVNIVLHYVSNREQAEKVKNDIDSSGGKCTLIQADLCDPACADELIQKVGGVDILILNASVQYKSKLESITIGEFYEQVNCNWLSSMLLIRRAVPYMRSNKWGRIITIGSVQEIKPHPDMLVYSSTKAAQANMVKSLALQFAKDGITVNNVAPGVIYTDRNVEALSDETYAQKVLDSIPVNFFGKKEDCVGMVRLLCSQEGRYITGQSIYVDGGKSL